MDIGSYQLNERLASAALPSWRLKALHSPHVFVNAGFPVRVQSTDELVGLLDTMQEGLFDAFIRELGGLDETDLEAFVDALTEYCLFFRINFPGRRVPLPLSTMIAHFTLARKLRGIGGPHRILEIGPGCGYLSFFLRHWTDLESYSQIETTESFYLLQNLVNKHVFRHRFQEHAQASLEGQAASFVTEAQAAGPHTEISPRLSLDLPPVCRHYPWWRIGEVAEQRFSVVTTNATLNEFSEEALAQYVWLIDRCLMKDGCLLVQCYGGGPGSLETIFRKLFGIRLAPVVGVLTGETMVGEQFMAKSNLLFVREGHPLFSKYLKGNLTFPLFEPDEPLVRAIYMPDSAGPRRPVDAGEIVAAVSARLKAA